MAEIVVAKLNGNVRGRLGGFKKLPLERDLPVGVSRSATCLTREFPRKCSSGILMKGPYPLR